MCRMMDELILEFLCFTKAMETLGGQASFFVLQSLQCSFPCYISTKLLAIPSKTQPKEKMVVLIFSM